MLAELHPSRKRPNPFFQDFNVPYDPDVPVSYLFGLVSKQRHWKPWSRTWKRNWNRCMQLEYERLIGCCNKNLDTWQDLCRLVGIDGTFLSIRQRKKALAGVHVSIVDVLDCWNTDKVPSCFASAAQLVKYMKRTNKTISRHLAKEDKVLKILMRQML